MAKTIAEQVGVFDTHDDPLSAAPPATPQQQPAEERPEWLPENFKSPEELAKAYDESRREMARAQTRAESSERAVAELAGQVEELRQQQQRVQQPAAGYDPSTDPYLVAEASALEEGDYMRAAQIRDARNMQLMQAAYEMWQPPKQQQAGPNDPALYASVVVQEMKNRYGDEWTPELMEEVGQAAEPFLSPDLPFQETINRLTFVADSIRNRKLAEQTVSLQGQQEQAARAKRQAQTAPGSSGRQPGGQSAEDALVERWSQMPRLYWAQGA